MLQEAKQFEVKILVDEPDFLTQTEGVITQMKSACMAGIPKEEFGVEEGLWEQEILNRNSAVHPVWEKHHTFLWENKPGVESPESENWRRAVDRMWSAGDHLMLTAANMLEVELGALGDQSERQSRFDEVFGGKYSENIRTLSASEASDLKARFELR